MKWVDVVIRNRMFQFAYILFVGFGIMTWTYREVSLLLVPAIVVVIVGMKEYLLTR